MKFYLALDPPAGASPALVEEMVLTQPWEKVQ
jgi:hypothetical protein